MTASIRPLVEQYVEVIAVLWTQRRLAVTGATHDLSTLAALDERLAAHIEGLQVSGAAGWHESLRAVDDTAGPGEAFAAAVLALDAGDADGLRRLLQRIEAAPGARDTADPLDGVVGACGWVERSRLLHIAGDWLSSPDARLRRLGVAACAAHRVEPRRHWAALIEDPVPAVRARALRLAGELGALPLLETCLDRAATDDHPEARGWAAWSAVLLGDREAGLRALLDHAAERPGGATFDLALQVQDARDAHGWLKRVAAQGLDLRTLLRGSGLVGDPAYVPWLLDQMAVPTQARLAGLSFSLITGASLETAPLRGEPVPGADAGPTDDPDDEFVGLDPDDGLPWPDTAAVGAWWQGHRERLPAGHRLLTGEAPHEAHLLRVLTMGRQRARAIAATALALRRPGQPLFDVEAPAARQRQALGARREEAASA